MVVWQTSLVDLFVQNQVFTLKVPIYQTIENNALCSLTMLKLDYLDSETCQQSQIGLNACWEWTYPSELMNTVSRTHLFWLIAICRK